MHFQVLIFAILCCFALYTSAEEILEEQQLTLPVSDSLAEESSVHTRSKRTIFLKKKILGAGLLGFGLGVVKGYKFGYNKQPEVHHVYLAAPPPPVKYVEYVEKPVFVERIVEKPVYQHDHHYQSYHPNPHSSYGGW